MKIILNPSLFSAVACAALLVSAHSVRADDVKKPARTPVLQNETSRKPAGKRHFNPATGSQDGPESGAITGTSIRKTYVVHGHHTDAAQPVYVIDRADPRFTSSATVAGVLRNVPFATVGR